MSFLKLTVFGEIRSKKNSKRVFHRNGRTIVLPSPAYEAWEKDVHALAYIQIDPQKFPITDPCNVEAVIYYKGNRPDLSGALESIGDVFEGLLWANDRQIESWDGSRLIKDNSQPRIELKLRWER